MYASTQADTENQTEILPTDYSVACMLELARLANVEFDVADGRLVMRASRIDWKVWPRVRVYLDEIGADALKAFVERAHGGQAYAQ